MILIVCDSKDERMYKDCCMLFYLSLTPLLQYFFAFYYSLTSLIALMIILGGRGAKRSGEVESKHKKLLLKAVLSYRII